MDKHIIEQCKSDNDCEQCDCQEVCKEQKQEQGKGSQLWTGNYEPDLG